MFNRWNIRGDVRKVSALSVIKQMVCQLVLGRMTFLLASSIRSATPKRRLMANESNRSSPHSYVQGHHKFTMHQFCTHVALV
ncbi:hypothetical protein PAXRUDRAFT_674701 [Paxillus rubicundulus Ve08.2h10]|uniref:Unplaced genomic scaffold scaffold_68, whole genome shotgun sequence n=1 Tax=Paxillus rubicundulus Ve08.2h10 TaxID=930991 RepID=A0A0D0DV63_9AGAM|nr:hypothetical protein PAXRUDRAFT_674701 [Paxillus rubicundulus Ve08.2h10]